MILGIQLLNSNNYQGALIHNRFPLHNVGAQVSAMMRLVEVMPLPGLAVLDLAQVCS